MDQCKATTAKGERCKGRPLVDGFCFAHSPRLQGRLSESRRAGGRNRSHTVRAMRHMPPDLKAAAGAIYAAITEVHDGNLETKRATAMAALASALVRVYQAGELEQRLAALEAAAELQPQRRRL